MRLAVVGKGGAGKSVISGKMARVLARQGPPLLALDSDLLPGLSFSLGAGEDPALPPLRDAAEKGEDGRWRLKKGIGPARAVRRARSSATPPRRPTESGCCRWARRRARDSSRSWGQSTPTTG